MIKPVVVVAGSTGITGFRMAQYMSKELGRSVTGLSRKAPPQSATFAHISVDLTNKEDCQQKLFGTAANKRSGLGQADYLFYAARYDPSATSSVLIDKNLQMFENLIDVMEKNSNGLKHVHLVHGTKYYGAPNGRYRTPSKEDDPRCLIDNFYYAQQDFITERQKGKSWTWSISRPQAVSDRLPSNATNLPWGISVYATICKAKGVPLSFPGSPGGYSAIYQCTDAEHLAKSAVWMSENPSCANHAFNVTNGDYFRWENLWPRIAEYFDMPVGPTRHINLEEIMAGQGACWDSLVQKHGLQSGSYAGLVSWSYLNFALAPDYDRMSDVTKLRKFGFHDVIDTEEMFLKFFDGYRKVKFIP